MKPQKLLIATRNKDKVREIKRLLADLNVKIISALDVDGLPEVEEDQDTLEGNALKKAQILFKETGIPTVADDTGLAVDYLNGEPGVYSSRYAGENVTYDANVNKLLEAMNNVPSEKRQAKFTTVLVYIDKFQTKIVNGVCDGTISVKRKGKSGFGYDPVFIVPSIGKTFSEMSLDEKNEISHRGKALEKFKSFLYSL
jgi:XTP/dITP diphosphohydrolase